MIRKNKPTNKSEPHSNSRPKSPLVFCIHGNKWGIATCCEELEGHEHLDGLKKPMVKQTFSVLIVLNFDIFLRLDSQLGGNMAAMTQYIVIKIEKKELIKSEMILVNQLFLSK